MVVVLVLLANLRAGLINLVAIPLSLVAAILVLHGLGATINTMTLAGMAIAIGKGEYRGYHVAYGGQFESAQETTRLLMLMGVAVVLGIALLLQVAFGSVRDALLVMVNLPLALVGACSASTSRTGS